MRKEKTELLQENTDKNKEEEYGNIKKCKRIKMRGKREIDVELEAIVL